MNKRPGRSRTRSLRCVCAGNNELLVTTICTSRVRRKSKVSNVTEVSIRSHRRISSPYCRDRGRPTTPDTVTFVISASRSATACNRIAVPPPPSYMENLIFYLIVQLNLIFGVAGLMWPDRMMPVFGVLMFPWPASRRAIRTHGVVSIVGYLLVVAKILVTAH
jgi:hypothetical protein